MIRKALESKTKQNDDLQRRNRELQKQIDKLKKQGQSSSAGQLLSISLYTEDVNNMNVEQLLELLCIHHVHIIVPLVFNVSRLAPKLVTRSVFLFLFFSCELRCLAVVRY